MTRSVLITLLSLGWFTLVGCTAPNRLGAASEIRLQLGLRYLEINDYQAAQRNLLQAHQSLPRDYRPILALARLWQQQGASQQAEAWYQQALLLAPKNGYVLNNYGAFLCSLMQYDKAERQFTAALTASEIGASSEAQTQSGFCLIRARQNQLAGLRLLSREPGYQPIAEDWLYQVGQWCEQKHYSSALTLLELYHQRFPASAESLWQMIYVAAQQGSSSVVTLYGNRLAQLFPYSIQYQRYIANEY